MNMIKTRFLQNQKQQNKNFRQDCTERVKECRHKITSTAICEKKLNDKKEHFNQVET